MTNADPQAAQEPQLLARGSAPGKLILLGEHFVVHGVPALALPLPLFTTRIDVLEDVSTAQVLLQPNAGASDDNARRVLARALERLALPAHRPWRLAVRATVPIGQGLGSSASFAVALIEALARAASRALTAEERIAHARALEQITHGTPSGIDDTVIALGVPIWFGGGRALARLAAPAELRLVLAASGIPRSTAAAVASVRALRDTRPAAFADLCAAAREVVEAGLRAFRTAQLPALGHCMNDNHALLQQVGVSTPALDGLAAAARAAGAHGAKLTGAGRGGFVVALVPRDATAAVERALREAGAAQTFTAEAFTVEAPALTAEEPPR